MSRDITKLHPIVRMLAEELVERCAEEGYIIKVTDCVRTKEEQNSLSSSVTQVKYPYSCHNWGVAFDICQNDKNNAYPSDNKWWNAVGRIGEDLGLEWGGSWKKFTDRPHFQLNTYGDCSKMVKTYGSPEKFFAHSDFKISTPKLAITPTSTKKKIIWLQTRLNMFGEALEIDGVWGDATTQAIKDWYWEMTGKECTGKKVSKKCIDMLAK